MCDVVLPGEDEGAEEATVSVPPHLRGATVELTRQDPGRGQSVHASGKKDQKLVPMRS